MKTGVVALPVSLRRLAFATLASLCLAAPAAADDYTDVNQLIRTGKLADAQARADKYLAGNPRDPQMRFLKGVIQTESGKQGDAIVTFTALTQEYPELPEPYNNLAVLYANQKQYDKARTALEMAIRTNPSYATAHENMGDVYAKLASQAYAKALQLDASNVNVPPKLALIRDLFSPAPAVRGGRGAAASAGAATPAAVSTASTKPATVSAAATPAPASPPAAAAPASPPVAPPVTAAAAPLGSPAAPSPSAATPAAPSAATTAQVSPQATPAPSALPDLPTGARQEIEATVRSWAAAWSDRNLKEYFAAYSKDFRPAGKQSRSAWEAERRARIMGKSRIRVAVSDLDIAIDGNKAVARFRQDYTAEALSVKGRKTLELGKSAAGWQIVRESTG